MPDVNPLDAMADAEEAALLKRLDIDPHSAAFKDEGEPQVTESTTTIIPVPAVADALPAPEPAPAAAPVAEPPATPTEPAAASPAEPESPATAEPPTAVAPAPAAPAPTWRQVHDLEKQNRDAIRELQIERERLAALERREAELRVSMEQRERQLREDAGLDLPTEVDPLQTLEQRLRAQEERSQHVEAQLAARNAEDSLRLQAVTFSKDHPDYEAAVVHYVESERRAAEMTGEIDWVADRLATVSSEQQKTEIRNQAMQRGVTETQVRRELAVAVMAEQRKQQLSQYATRAGKQLPEVIYGLAHERGFTGGGNGTTPAAPPASPAVPSAAAEVRQAQAAAAASSLATLAQAGTPAPKTILRKSDFRALKPDEQERWVTEMDQKDPGWDERLIDD